MEFIIIIALVLVLIITACVKPTIVSGQSMDDTLHNGNYLIVNKLAYKFGEPKHGDIIVFDSGDEEHELWVKRVIGLPGDVIKTDDKTLYINDAKASEPYIKKGTVAQGEMQTWTVPEGAIFVMGDNRNNSTDSRIIGCVEDKRILGKAVLRLWPFGSIGRIR
jgi:signal peptidase I